MSEENQRLIEEVLRKHNTADKLFKVMFFYLFFFKLINR